MDNQSNNAVEVLRKAGYRATRGKITVLQTLMREKRHFSVRQLAKKLANTRINEATFYRVLGTLVSSGLVKKIHLGGDNVSYYEYAANHHHHVACLGCDITEEFSDADCERIIANATRNLRSFNILSGHSIELSGLCNSCAEQGSH